jgi:hypothetical protein
MKQTYTYVLEMQPCELMAVSLGSVNSNLDGDYEKIVVSDEPVEEGFWGR